MSEVFVPYTTEGRAAPTRGALRAARVGVGRFGDLGLMLGVGAQNASQAQRTTSDVGTGASIGATVGSIVPGIGTAIGAAVGAAVGAIGSLFGPAKEGQAAVTWDDVVNHGYLLKNTNPLSYDERYFGEALKGAMDKGNNIWPGCGADGYKNPDCFYSALAKIIVAGYLAKKVPITADPADVWAKVVVPWLSAGAGGLFNWRNALAEAQAQGLPYSQQELLIEAAMTRYLNGLPITRADMPAYAAQRGAYASYHVPEIRTALSSLLNPPKATVTALPKVVAAPAKAVTPTQSKTIQPVTAPKAVTPAKPATAAPTTAQTAAPSPAAASAAPAVDPQLAAEMQALMAQGASQQQAITAALNALAANGTQITPQVQQAVAAAAQPSMFSTNTLMLIGGGLLVLYFVMRK